MDGNLVLQKVEIIIIRSETKRLVPDNFPLHGISSCTVYLLSDVQIFS